jgi:predicted RNA-binding protein
MRDAGQKTWGGKRFWHIWEFNIKTNLKEVSCEDVEWIHIVQDRVQCWDLVNTVMNLQVP